MQVGLMTGFKQDDSSSAEIDVPSVMRTDVASFYGCAFSNPICESIEQPLPTRSDAGGHRHVAGRSPSRQMRDAAPLVAQTERLACA